VPTPTPHPPTAQPPPHTPETAPSPAAATSPPPKKRSRWRWVRRIAALLILLLIAIRIALPFWVRNYVLKTIDADPLYHGEIEDVDLQLFRGGYTIKNLRLQKTTGNVPVPFFSARRVELSLETRALLSGKMVGRIRIQDPEMNFVDSSDPATAQTGAEGGGGPWLQMIRDLFPFHINSAEIHNGSIHFRAFQKNPPVDVYLSNLNGTIENLTNIHDEVKPLITTVDATATAMGQARFEFHMLLDPFSYHPTFQLGVRLLGLDVTQVNSLAKAYGQFDFQRGYFDLVIELNAKEGLLDGYVKPLFRNITILSLEKDIPKDNIVEFFWEALVGLTNELLKNHPRDQFATVIPLTGDLTAPDTDILTIIGNVLRNAFIRAYLPRFQGVAPDVDSLHFHPGSVTEPLPGGM
jgi:hypothetical protein